MAPRIAGILLTRRSILAYMGGRRHGSSHKRLLFDGIQDHSKGFVLAQAPALA
jgi:hypothetical protein